MNMTRGKSQPLITIATVTFNAEPTLGKTLDSVARQDYPRIEHLIIDGCSTDHTLGLVQRYVEHNTITSHSHSIRLVLEPDEGLYDAMNKALQLASGDYIVFLNSGDCLHSATTVSDVVRASGWEEGDFSNPGIIYGETDIVDPEGNFLRHRRLKAPEQLSWRSFQQGMLVCHQSLYVRTDLARTEQYNLKYRFSADFDWCIRLMRKMDKRHIRLINSHLILTDYLSEGLTTRNHRRSLCERMHIMAHHYGWASTIAHHAWFVLRAVIRK